jgi:hypothetical protein
VSRTGLERRLRAHGGLNANLRSPPRREIPRFRQCRKALPELEAADAVDALERQGERRAADDAHALKSLAHAQLLDERTPSGVGQRQIDDDRAVQAVGEGEQQLPRIGRTLGEERTDPVAGRGPPRSACSSSSRRIGRIVASPIARGRYREP